MYQWDFGILWSYRWLFLNGLGVTVGFTVVIVVLGLVFGLIGHSAPCLVSRRCV